MKKKIILAGCGTAVIVPAVLTYVYSFKRAAVILLLTAAGVLFPSLPLFFIGRMLKADRLIMRRGEKHIGLCIGYTRGSRCRFGALTVELTASDGRTVQRTYNAMRFRFRYPHEITVYTLDAAFLHSNLGVQTILREILYFLLFFAIWLICTAGTLGLILHR